MNIIKQSTKKKEQNQNETEVTKTEKTEHLFHDDRTLLK